MKTKLFSAVLLSAALLVGCGGDEENVDSEGCEHLQKGPSAPVTATASAMGAPAVSNDHRRYDITLVDVTGGKGGSVSFAVSEATDYILFTGADVPVVVKDANGQTIAFEQSATSSTECTDIQGRFTVPLAVGTQFITFGPASATSVSLVIEEASGGDDHEG